MKNFAIMHTTISSEEVATLYTMKPGTARYYFPTTDVTMTAVWEKTPITTDVLSVQSVNWYIVDNTLWVTGIQSASIELYSLAGQQVRAVYQTNALSLGMLQGVFVVRITDEKGGLYTERIVLDERI